MKVRKGFSTDYAKNKFDVEIDEADLTRLLAEHQFPEAHASKITTAQVFRLMDTLSEWLMLTEGAKISQESAQRAPEAMRAYYATADAVRTELGLTPVYTAFLNPQAAPDNLQ